MIIIIIILLLYSKQVQGHSLTTSLVMKLLSGGVYLAKHLIFIKPDLKKKKKKKKKKRKNIHVHVYYTFSIHDHPIHISVQLVMSA